MKVYHHPLVLFLLICSIGLGLSFPSQLFGQELNVMEGKQAPNFVLKDLSGHKFRLSDYRGRPVLLLFMTTWIKGCWEMIPHMKESYSTYGTKGLVLFNIDVMESGKRAAEFAKEKMIPYPTLLDEDGKVRLKFGVFSVPVMILVSREGRIICWNCPDFEELLQKEFTVR